MGELTGSRLDNDHGRIKDKSEIVRGMFVCGWLKRGPSGIIGTNRPDSAETVNSLIEDFKEGKLAERKQSFDSLIESKGLSHQVTTWEDWLHIEKLEKTSGEQQGKGRSK